MPAFRAGTDNFKKYRLENGYFVDKSMLIKEVIEGADVLLLPRPRRFGKTLNVSMLRYFFEQSEEDYSALLRSIGTRTRRDRTGLTPPPTPSFTPSWMPVDWM